MVPISTAWVSFARLAVAQGDLERATLLSGAAEGLRQRVGIQLWPVLRQWRAERMAKLRGALGNDRFDRVYTAGLRFSLAEAVTTAQDLAA